MQHVQRLERGGDNENSQSPGNARHDHDPPECFRFVAAHQRSGKPAGAHIMLNSEYVDNQRGQDHKHGQLDHAHMQKSMRIHIVGRFQVDHGRRPVVHIRVAADRPDAVDHHDRTVFRDHFLRKAQFCRVIPGFPDRGIPEPGKFRLPGGYKDQVSAEGLPCHFQEILIPEGGILIRQDLFLIRPVFDFLLHLVQHPDDFYVCAAMFGPFQRS